MGTLFLILPPKPVYGGRIRFKLREPPSDPRMRGQARTVIAQPENIYNIITGCQEHRVMAQPDYIIYFQDSKVKIAAWISGSSPPSI